MPQWKKDLIFVVVFIGENLGEDGFYICKNSDIQEIIYDMPRDIVPQMAAKKEVTVRINSIERIIDELSNTSTISPYPS